MESRKKSKKNNYDVDIQACSTTDCTGLIPAAPETEDEIEAYQEIHQFIPQAKAVKKD